MSGGKFRGDTEGLASRLEEMASAAYGLPKDDRSKKTAEETAAILIALSGVKCGQDEEPILPRPPVSPGKGGRHG